VSQVFLKNQCKFSLQGVSTDHEKEGKKLIYVGSTSSYKELVRVVQALVRMPPGWIPEDSFQAFLTGKGLLVRPRTCLRDFIFLQASGYLRFPQ